MNSALDSNATKKIAGEGFQRGWPSLIKIDETAAKARVGEVVRMRNIQKSK